MQTLVDTGILLRLLDEDDPLHPMLRQAVQLLRDRRVQRCMTSQNVCEFWNVALGRRLRGALNLDAI